MKITDTDIFVVNADPHLGDRRSIASLAVDGPIAAPGGVAIGRYANLSFEWRDPRY